MRYTDPDIPLAQSDEDKILGIDPPQIDEEGRFLALQIRLQLGTACYATMALREVTKIDTSSHIQTFMTTNSEDQLYRGVGKVDAGTPVENVDIEDNVEMEAVGMEIVE
jgi:tRNA pseudouridine13 synthase